MYLFIAILLPSRNTIDQRHHKEERVYFGLRFYRDKNPSVTGMAAGQDLSEGGGRGGYILHVTSVVYLLQ